MGVQFLRSESGEEIVQMSRRDYDMLLARGGDEEAEDRAADHLVREARIARDERLGAALPVWLSAAILAGEHPIRAARLKAGLSRGELASLAGVGEAQLSDAEGGTRPLAVPALAALARALEVEAEWLQE